MTEFRLGSWARSGGFTGLVAAVADGEVALFDPAARQLTRVAAEHVQRVPAGAVTVTVRVDLPLPHGLAEDDVRRWVAALTDEVLRERAGDALRDQGLDDGAALPQVRVSVTPLDGGGVLCVAGHRVPGPDEATACPACGREAVPRPPRAAQENVFGLDG